MVCFGFGVCCDYEDGGGVIWVCIVVGLEVCVVLLCDDVFDVGVDEVCECEMDV